MTTEIKISFTILFAIVFSSGILSGIVNYLMHNFSNRWRRSAFVNCLFYGIFFSAMVLFFLQLFVTTVSGKPEDMVLIHVTFAFVCFMASIFLYLFMRLLFKHRDWEQN